MTLKLTSQSIQASNATPYLERVGLHHKNTGVPIFVLPSFNTEEERLIRINNFEGLTHALGKPDNALDRLNNQIIKLFFEAGGEHCLALMLPSSRHDLGSVKEAVVRAFMGENGGFNKRSGLFQLLNFQEAGDLILAPTLTLILDQERLAFLSDQLIQAVEASKRCMLLLDAPLHTDATAVADYAERFDSDRAVLLCAKMRRRSTGTWLPASPFAAAAFQRNDRERSIEHTPANQSITCDDLEVDQPTDELVQKWVSYGIHTVLSFAPQQFVLWGSKTLAKTNDYRQFVGCSRFITAVKESLEEILDPFVLGVCTETERAHAESAVGHFFRSYYNSIRRDVAGENIKLPGYQLSMDKSSELTDGFVLNVTLYLTLPMTWIDLHMQLQG